MENNVVSLEVAKKSTPSGARCKGCGNHIGICICRLPKEPTKSQSFDDELIELFEQAFLRGAAQAGKSADLLSDGAKFRKNWLAAIKATVEKHYQIKEEVNE